MKLSRFLSLLLLLLSYQGVWCQMSPELRTYYTFVNHAELAIVDSNYQLAIKHYQTAFDYKSNPFIKDRYNLAICLAIQKNYKSCYSQLVFVVDKGVSIYQLKKRSELEEFFCTRFGTKLIDYEKTHQKKYNLAYRSAIDSLVRMDQLFRNTEGSYFVYGDTIRSIDSLNVLALNELVALYGFPSEDLIGVDSSLQFGRPPFHAIIIHQQHGSPNRFWDYTDLFSQALENGEIETHAAAEYIWKCSGKDELGVMDAGLIQLVIDSTPNANVASKTKPDRLYSPFGYFRIDQEKENAVNNRRDSLGLESLVDARRKTVFRQHDRRFVFPGSTVSVLVCADQNQFNRMAKDLIWID